MIKAHALCFNKVSNDPNIKFLLSSYQPDFLKTVFAMFIRMSIIYDVLYKSQSKFHQNNKEIL